MADNTQSMAFKTRIINKNLDFNNDLNYKISYNIK